jgi:hypothetical protein
MSVVISHLIGGLGNQMFQYAYGRSISALSGSVFLIDIDDLENRYNLHNGYELNRVFNVDVGIATQLDLYSVLGWQAIKGVKRILSHQKAKIIRKDSFVVEPKYGYLSNVKDVHKNCYLVGYWQSEKYFDATKKLIKSEFSFKNDITRENAAIKCAIDNCNSVSLHVRRGDYISNKKTNAVHGVCSIEYYQSAINYIDKNVLSPIYFIFSDDIEWVAKNIKIHSRVVYVDHNKCQNSFYDMQLMSFCKHNIIANSSFSWWGAWLNDNNNKIVLAPKKWYSDNDVHSDLLPESWIRL